MKNCENHDVTISRYNDYDTSFDTYIPLCDRHKELVNDCIKIKDYTNIDGKGYIPRPTDQRFKFSMFFQDYMPQFPSMKVNLTLIYASGLPNGASVFSDPYQYTKTLPSYKRVDIGLTKVFIDTKDYKATSNF